MGMQQLMLEMRRVWTKAEWTRIDSKYEDRLGREWPSGHSRKEKCRAAQVAGWRCCDLRWGRGEEGGIYQMQFGCVAVFEVPVRYPRGEVLCCSDAQSGLTLCDSVDYRLPGSSVHGIILAMILECCHCLLQGSSWLRDRTWVSRGSHTGRRIL